MDGWVGFNLLILSGGMCLGPRIKPVKRKEQGHFQAAPAPSRLSCPGHDDTGNLVLEDRLNPLRG